MKQVYDKYRKRKINHDVLLFEAIQLSDIAAVSKLLVGHDIVMDSNTFYPHCLDWAARYGNVEIVRLLLDDNRFDPALFNNQAIQLAAFFGHTKVVQLLLADQRVDPSDANNLALISAINHGYLDIVKLLFANNKVSLPIKSSQYYCSLIKVSVEMLFTILTEAKVSCREFLDLVFSQQLDKDKASNIKKLKQLIGYAARNGRSELFETLCFDKRVGVPTKEDLGFMVPGLNIQKGVDACPSLLIAEYLMLNQLRACFDSVLEFYKELEIIHPVHFDDFRARLLVLSKITLNQWFINTKQPPLIPPVLEQNSPALSALSTTTTSEFASPASFIATDLSSDMEEGNLSLVSSPVLRFLQQKQDIDGYDKRSYDSSCTLSKTPTRNSPLCHYRPI